MVCQSLAEGFNAVIAPGPLGTTFSHPDPSGSFYDVHRQEEWFFVKPDHAAELQVCRVYSSTDFASVWLRNSILRGVQLTRTSVKLFGWYNKTRQQPAV